MNLYDEIVQKFYENRASDFLRNIDLSGQRVSKQEDRICIEGVTKEYNGNLARNYLVKFVATCCYLFFLQ